MGIFQYLVTRGLSAESVFVIFMCGYTYLFLQGELHALISSGYRNDLH